MNFLGTFMQALKPRHEDDVIDRLNYYYSTIIILILSITISAKQYVGQPIQCWVPKEFTNAWEQYAENYCFVQNTYWTPMHEAIPNSQATRRFQEIGYYQWVPFILALEALMFYVPCVVWRVLSFQSGFNVETVVKLACEADNIGNENREKAVKTASTHMEDTLNLQYGFSLTESKLTQIIRCGKSKGVFLTSMYLLVKALYVVNAIGQFFLLNAFLHVKSHSWGFELLQDLCYGRQWESSGNFPRVTLCDFKIRAIGTIRSYTIQCVLMINMFNEKVFLFLWWWFVFVIMANVCSFVYWLAVMCTYGQREAFVTRYLKITRSPDTRDTPGLSRFVEFGLRPDGVFLLRLLAINAGDLATTEIVDRLWTLFQTRMLSDPHYRGQQGKRNVAYVTVNRPPDGAAAVNGPPDGAQKSPVEGEKNPAGSQNASLREQSAGSLSDKQRLAGTGT